MQKMSTVLTQCVILLAISQPAASVRHFIPHSHQDLGWLMTIDQYYDTKVRDILSSVLKALESPEASEKDRKFVYAEVGFLKKFLDEHKDDKPKIIERVKELIASRRFEFINGAMSQADSACPHYEDIIANYFYGMRYLKLNFDTEPQSAWQIDPFGHSKALMYIARQLGLKHAVINRISDDMKDQKLSEQKLQFKWVYPDNSFSIVHLTTNGYSSPDAIQCDRWCFKWLFNKHFFEKDISNKSKGYKADPFFLIGEDFFFSNAPSTFGFLDYVLSASSDIKYSLFSEYVKAVEPIESQLEEFKDDFFVYTSGEFASDHWSGYFTTKPLLKYKIRESGKRLRATTVFLVREILADPKIAEEIKTKLTADVIEMAEDFGLLLHHDTITGTSVEAVDEDFLARLTSLDERYAGLLSTKMGNGLIFCDFADVNAGSLNCQFPIKETGVVNFFIHNSSLVSGVKLMTISLPRATKKLASFHLTRKSPAEAEIPVTPVCKPDHSYCELFFKDEIAIFGVNTYTLSIKIDDKVEQDDHQVFLMKSGLLSGGKQDLAIAFIDQTFTFSDFTLVIKEGSVLYQHKNSPGAEHEISYRSIDSGSSGHYLLKYKGKLNFEPYNKIQETLEIKSNEIEGVYITGTKVDMKIVKEIGKSYFTVESLVKKSDELDKGADIILNIDTKDIDSKDFVTDSNGLFEMTRTKTDVFEKSVYPFTSFARVSDPSKKNGVEVFNDRAQGVISNGPGNLMIYIQRSANTDDNKGNPEVLKVHSDVAVKHNILYFADEVARQRDRVEIIDRQNNYLMTLFVSEKSPKEQIGPLVAPVTAGQYANIRLVFNIIDSKRIIIRVQNTNFWKREIVDLKTLFASLIGPYRVDEVDFDHFVRRDSPYPKPISNLYDLIPLGFVTFILNL